MTTFLGESPHILVPVLEHAHLGRIAEIAAALGGSAPARITAVDVVPVPAGADLSTGATGARTARIRLEQLARALPTRVETMVRIDRSVAEGVAAVASEIQPDMVLVEWAQGRAGERPGSRLADEIVRAVDACDQCHLALLKLGPAGRLERILVAVRGGPHAELALSSAGAIATGVGLRATVLHVMPPGLTWEARRASEHSLDAMAGQYLVENERVVREADDVSVAIVDESCPSDLLLIGASIGPHATDETAPVMGTVPAQLMKEARGSVMVVKTREDVPAATFDELATRPGTLVAVDRAAEELRAIPARVDRWFAESSYHHSEFADLRWLAQLKAKQGVSVSLVLPTLDEEATIGPIVRAAREQLMDRWHVVDEILVIDSASTDRSREIAAAEGARVVSHPDVLAQYGTYRGKGEALWKSLFETTGDIVVWADTDVQDWHPRMVYGTLGPLLANPRLQYVKGYYQRPIVEGGEIREGGGGRVTELVARPMINLLYPELSGFIQPLAGEYAGRRALLEAIPFFTGYAVEIGHLIDTYERVGLEGLGQVDLERRVHRNQELEGLSRMSFVILQAVLRRLETGRRATLFAELGSRMKLPRSGPGDLRLEVIELEDQERPPMTQIPEYAARAAR